MNDRVLKVNSVDFFKFGIRPEWEDPANQEGGYFRFHLLKEQENHHEIYEDLTYLVIGEEF